MQYKYNTNTNIYKMYKGYQVIWNQYYLFKVKYLFQNYFKPDHHRFTVASFRLMIMITKCWRNPHIITPTQLPRIESLFLYCLQESMWCIDGEIADESSEKEYCMHSVSCYILFLVQVWPVFVQCFSLCLCLIASNKKSQQPNDVLSCLCQYNHTESDVQ